MTYKDLKNKIKEEQKTLAHLIRIGKPLRKPSNYDNAKPEAIPAYHSLVWNQWEYRNKHIAYCEFFNNTPYSLIENFSYTRPDGGKVKRFKNEWEGELDEALRDCA